MQPMYFYNNMPLEITEEVKDNPKMMKAKKMMKAISKETQKKGKTQKRNVIVMGECKLN